MEHCTPDPINYVKLSYASPVINTMIEICSVEFENTQPEVFVSGGEYLFNS